MVYERTGSVEGGTGWYLVILGQYGEDWLVLGWLVLVDI